MGRFLHCFFVYFVSELLDSIYDFIFGMHTGILTAGPAISLVVHNFASHINARYCGFAVIERGYRCGEGNHVAGSEIFSGGFDFFDSDGTVKLGIDD